MNPDGQIIPIVEDDQGGGFKDPLTIDDIELVTKYDDSDFAEKMERFRRRKEILTNK